MKLFIKKSFFISLPILIIAACYIITDPYKKIWNYDNYACDYVMLNRGDVSTRVYLKNRGKYHYNSFIFGSSRSTANTSSEWRKYLPGGSMPYSYGSWSESIKGIYKKVALIDSLGDKIDNAFIVVDDYTFTPHFSEEITTYDHYLISGDSKIMYHLRSFFSYLTNPLLILTSIDYSIFHKKRGYMKDFVGMKPDDLDPVTNDWMVHSEETIKSDSIGYYKNCLHKFYPRSKEQLYYNRQISREEEIYLLGINHIFQKHGTHFKIVIAPLYDQKKFNTEDLSLLRTIFDSTNVFDFSGINAITNDYHNYASDAIHYRKKIGNLIFKEVYGK